MSVIKAILQPDPDGSLHLPLPEELRRGKVKIEATLEPAEGPKARPAFGCLAGKIWIAPDFDEPLEDFKEYATTTCLSGSLGITETLSTGC